MTIPRAERLQRALARASVLPPAERPAYLDVACRGDAPLRAEVESLLRSHDEAGRFLATLPADPCEGPARVGTDADSGPASTLEADNAPQA